MGGPKKINAALSEKTSGGGWSKRGRPRHDDRPFVEAMLWIARTGCPWRDLPAEFPKWQSVYTRWRRWVQRRIWARVLAWLAEGHDREAYAVDATYVRVHAHGTRARGGYAAQAVGRSRGGLTSKVHLLTDALGYPVRFVITGGECNDVTQAPALLPPGTGAQVLCDRGYDADWWRDRLLAAGHQPVIPGRRHRLLQPAYDVFTYRARHLVENTFARLKSSRRIATRYEQTASAYAAFVALACVCLWLM
jgi:transposase